MNLGVISGRRPCGLLFPLLLAAAGTCLPAPSSAQPPPTLKLLQPLAEDRANVDIVAGTRRTTVRGTLLEVSESALVLDGPNGRMEFPASDVREVWNPGGPRFRKPLIIGTAVGLGFGLLAKAADGDCMDPASSCAVDGPMTAGDIAVVTAVGAATGLGWAWWKRQPRRLLYLGPEPTPAPAGTVTPVVPEAPPPAPTPATTDVRPDWLSLGRLRGQNIEVAQRGERTTAKGPLIDVTAEGIQMLVDGRPFVVAQPEVEKVWSEPRVEWWRVPVAALYFTLGTGTLAAVAACTWRPESEQSNCAGWAYGITAGVHVALLSYRVAKKHRDALAYDASRPVPASTSTFMLQPALGRRSIGIAGAYSF